MFLNNSKRFPRIFKPLYNMEACFKNNRRLFSQQTNIKNENEENPFMKKYQDKMIALQKSCPEEYKSRMEMLKPTKNSANNISEKKPAPSEHKRDDTAKSQPSPVSCHQIKTLDEIVKFDILKTKSSQEIEMIWKEYHKNKQGLYAILPSESFERLHSKSIEYPTFLLPLPKHDRYDFVMCQFTGNTCYFTLLENFQKYKQHSPACLSVTYYSELQADKGIVLMRGEFDENTISPLEAQCLSNQLTLYYSGDDAKKDSLLYNFNKKPDDFKHMELIFELESGVGK